MTAKNSIYLYMSEFFLVLYFLELVFPRINNIIEAPYVCLFCAWAWMLLTFIVDNKFYLHANIHRLFPIIYYILTIILPYIFGYPVISHRYASLALIPLGNIIFEFYKTHSIMNRLKKIILAISIMAFSTGINTFYALLNNSYISRSIKSSGEYSEYLASQGVGGYSFIYFVTACSILLLYILLSTKNQKMKIISVVLYIFQIALIIKSNYLTSFLTVTICSVIMLLAHVFQNASKHKVELILFIVIVLFAAMNIDRIIMLMSKYLPNRIASVINFDLNRSIISSVYEEFIWDRWPVLQLSIQSFLKYPFFGLLGSAALTTTGEYLTGFGQHSYVLDTFALYGFGIGIVNIFIIVKPLKYNGSWVKHSRTINISMFICMVIIYVMNNATEAIALVFCVIFPLVRDLYVWEDSNQILMTKLIMGKEEIVSEFSSQT